MAVFRTVRSVRSSYTLGSRRKSPGPWEEGADSKCLVLPRLPQRTLSSLGPSALPLLTRFLRICSLQGPPLWLTKDGRTFVGTQVMKCQVKEGAESVT